MKAGYYPRFRKFAVIKADEPPALEVTVIACRVYWIALPTDENTLLAFEPINRIVPITITNMMASMTAYSATS